MQDAQIILHAGDRASSSLMEGGNRERWGWTDKELSIAWRILTTHGPYVPLRHLQRHRLRTANSREILAVTARLCSSPLGSFDHLGVLMRLPKKSHVFYKCPPHLLRATDSHLEKFCPLRSSRESVQLFDSEGLQRSNTLTVEKYAQCYHAPLSALSVGSVGTESFTQLLEQSSPYFNCSSVVNLKPLAEQSRAIEWNYDMVE